MTLLHSYPVGQRVELNQLGRDIYRRRHPLRDPYPSGTVVGRGRKLNTIRVRIDARARPETFPARYWRPILKP